MKKISFSFQIRRSAQTVPSNDSRLANLRSNRVVERTQVPELLIRSVPGRCAFQEERAVVWPINFFADEAVNHASRELLDEHRARHASAEKIIVQVLFYSKDC